MRIQILATTVAVVFGLASTTGFAAERNGPPKPAAKIDGVQATFFIPNAELLYTPITPCRAFGAQTISAATAKNFRVTGADLNVQGGPAGGCGVPASARSVTVNLTATNTTYPGYLTAYALGATRPAITSVTLQNGNITNSTMVALGAAGNISIYSNKTATVFGDVTGYFAPQIAGMIKAYTTDPSVYTGPRFLSVSRSSKGHYTVFVDRAVDFCIFNTQNSFYGEHSTNAYGFTGSQFNLTIYEKADNGAITYFDNDYVYVSIHC